MQRCVGVSHALGVLPYHPVNGVHPAGQRQPQAGHHRQHVPQSSHNREPRPKDHRKWRWWERIPGAKVSVTSFGEATGRGHQRQQLVANVGSTRATAQVNVPVNQLIHSQMMGQSHRQDQPSVVHQTVVVVSGWFSLSKTIIPEAESTFLPLHDGFIPSVDWG